MFRKYYAVFSLFTFYIILIGFFNPTYAEGTKQEAKTFKEKLNKMGLLFNQPKNFYSVPIKPNGDVAYDYAVRHKNLKLEIRYSLRPDVKDPRAPKLFLAACALNINGGVQPNLAPFRPQDVKNEFNADRGFTTVTDLNSEFGKGYKTSSLFIIQKDGKGSVVVTYLFDDINLIMPTYLNTFYSIKFIRDTRTSLVQNTNPLLSPSEKMEIEKAKQSWHLHCPRWNQDGQKLNSRFKSLVRSIDSKKINHKEISDRFSPYRNLDCPAIWKTEMPECVAMAQRNTKKNLQFRMKVRNCLNRNQWHKNNTPEKKKILAELEYLLLNPQTISNSYDDIHKTRIAVLSYQIKPKDLNINYEKTCSTVWVHGKKAGCRFSLYYEKSGFSQLGIQKGDIAMYVNKERIFEPNKLNQKVKTFANGTTKAFSFVVRRGDIHYEIRIAQ